MKEGGAGKRDLDVSDLFCPGEVRWVASGSDWVSLANKGLAGQRINLELFV